MFVCVCVFALAHGRKFSSFVCGGVRALSTKTAALRDKGGRGCRGGVPFSATETYMSAL